MKNNDCLTEQQLSLYCTDDFDANERQVASEHLAGCLDCKYKLAEIQKALALLPRRDLELSEAEKLQFTARVVESARKKRPNNRFQTWGAAATAVTAGVLAVMIFGPANLQVENTNQQNLQYAELDLVENMEFLEEMEMLDMLDLLELLNEKG